MADVDSDDNSLAAAVPASDQHPDGGGWVQLPEEQSGLGQASPPGAARGSFRDLDAQRGYEQGPMGLQSAMPRQV